jgi:hypothetical protein
MSICVDRVSPSLLYAVSCAEDSNDTNSRFDAPSHRTQRGREKGDSLVVSSKCWAGLEALPVPSKSSGGADSRGALRGDCGPGGILELRKITVQMVADHKSARALFERLGFHVEALLPDWVEDREGRCHDLLLMAHNLSGTPAAGSIARRLLPPFAIRE